MFLGMEVEQPGKVIKLHLDSQEVIAEYKAYQESTSSEACSDDSWNSPSRLTMEVCPILSDPRKQKYYQSFIAKLQLAASCI